MKAYGGRRHDAVAAPSPLRDTEVTMHRLAVLGVLLTALLAGCGGSAQTPVNEPGWSDADVAFVRTLIVHNQHAIQLAGTVTAAAGAEASQLAAGVLTQRADENRRLTGLLIYFGEPLVDPSASPTPSSTPRPSPTPTASPSSTSTAQKAEFVAALLALDRLDLELATTEKDEGRYGRARDLAASIATARVSEIDTCERLLSGR
jgi:uncharacterized protein (DUF305 family)